MVHKIQSISVEFAHINFMQMKQTTLENVMTSGSILKNKMFLCLFSIRYFVAITKRGTLIFFSFIWCVR